MSFDLRHALDVAGRVTTDEEKLVALLHDTVEDGACTLLDLTLAGFPDAIVRAVGQLTRGTSETYERYIRRIAEEGGWLANQVKIADLNANLDRMDDAHTHLERRWRDALAKLQPDAEGT